MWMNWFPLLEIDCCNGSCMLKNDTIMIAIFRIPFIHIHVMIWETWLIHIEYTYTQFNFTFNATVLVTFQLQIRLESSAVIVCMWHALRYDRNLKIGSNSKMIRTTFLLLYFGIIFLDSSSGCQWMVPLAENWLLRSYAKNWHHYSNHQSIFRIDFEDAILVTSRRWS